MRTKPRRSILIFYILLLSGMLFNPSVLHAEKRENLKWSVNFNNIAISEALDQLTRLTQIKINTNKPILAKADKANLVLQPSNSKEISFLCTCCGCCCGALLRLKQLPKPSEIVASPFIAHATPETCDGCGKCIDTCPMDVLRLDKEKRKAFIKYHEDCMSCFICEEECPNPGTIYVSPKRAEWVRLPW